MICRTVPILDLDDAGDDTYGRDHNEFGCSEILARDDSDCDHIYVGECGVVRCISCGRRAA